MTTVHRKSCLFGPACLGLAVALLGSLTLAAPAQAHPRGNRYNQYPYNGYNGASVTVRVGSSYPCQRPVARRYYPPQYSYPGSYSYPQVYSYPPGYGYPPTYGVVLPQPYFPYYNSLTVQTYTRPSPEVVVDSQGVVRFKNPPGY